jgi:5S rRNA maturation endonuclease (ribonuclease M5)
MRAPLEVRLEKLRRLIDRLSYESHKGSVIVVEGIRDRDSLRKMGITGRVLCLQSSRKNTLGFVEELQGAGDVIVLTDFDREGTFLARKLARILNAERMRSNLILWRDLRRLTRSDIRSIEELPKYYQRLQVKELFHLPSRSKQSREPLNRLDSIR